MTKGHISKNEQVTFECSVQNEKGRLEQLLASIARNWGHRLKHIKKKGLTRKCGRKQNVPTTQTTKELKKKKKRMPSSQCS